MRSVKSAFALLLTRVTEPRQPSPAQKGGSVKRTISAMRGKGSLTHNRRDFIAENVDSSRTPLNVEYRNEDI